MSAEEGDWVEVEVELEVRSGTANVIADER